MRNSGNGLSKASVYEQMFGTVKRGVGRPAGDTDPVFASAADLERFEPAVVSAAKRRAYAVIHEENRVRLREVFLKELKVLDKRNRKSSDSSASSASRSNG